MWWATDPNCHRTESNIYASHAYVGMGIETKGLQNQIETCVEANQTIGFFFFRILSWWAVRHVT